MKMFSGYYHEPLQCADIGSRGRRGYAVLGRKQKWFMMAMPIVIVLLISLVLHAPASLVVSRLAPVMAANGADAGSVALGGTLLDGQLQTRRQGMPLYIAWQLQLSSLWRFAYGADLILGGPVALNANWQKQPGQWSLQVTDVRSQAGDASWLLPQLVMPAWRSDTMQFARNTKGEWLNASGELVTQGGLLRLNLQGQIQEMQIPAAVRCPRAFRKDHPGMEESPGSTGIRCRLTAGGGNPRDSATENKPPAQGRVTPRARAKRCGKSAPRPWQQGRQGKPHREQDHIGTVYPRGTRAFPLSVRVGRVRRAVRRVPEEWPPPPQGGTEPGLQAT